MADGHLARGAGGHLLFADPVKHLALDCDACDCNDKSPDTTTQAATITVTCGDCTDEALGTPSYSNGTWTWAGAITTGCDSQMVTLKCKLNGNWEIGLQLYADDVPLTGCWGTIEIPCADIEVVNGKFVPKNGTMWLNCTCNDPNDSPVKLVWA